MLDLGLNNSDRDKKGSDLPISDAAQSAFLGAIAKLLEAQNATPPLQPIPRDRPLALSFGQERLWCLQQLSPDNPCYNQPIAFHLLGALDGPALDRSFQELLRRHEALRTSFASIDGQLVQQIRSFEECRATFRLHLLNLAHQHQPETQLPDVLLQDIQRPFDLAEELPWRATLVELGKDDRVLLVTLHHIIGDGWSEGILLRELSSFYTAFVSGNPSPLPELPIQYADFAHWQRECLQGDRLTDRLAYWKQNLSGNVPGLKLPTNASSAAISTYRGMRRSFVLSDSLTQALKTLSQQQGVTLFVLLLAAFKTLLYRYTGQEDLVVCSPFADRSHAKLENLIGYFNNVLPLRTSLAGDLTFRDVLSQVACTCQGAFEHQDVPLQEIARLPGVAGKPLSKAMFALLNVPDRPLVLPGINIRALEVHNGAADFDLFLLMREKEKQLVGTLQYKVDRFDEAIVTQLLEQYQKFLELLVAHPDRQLSDLPLLHVKHDPEAKKTQPDKKTNQTPEKTFVAPRDATERQLVEIWEQALDIRPIGVRDNFFELGGHSLLAVRLVAEIERAFEKKVPPAALLQSPTIEQFARVLRSNEPSTLSSACVTLQPEGSKPPLFCIHVLGQGMAYYRPMARYLGTDRPIYGLSSQIVDRQEAPANRVEEMAAFYIREMQRLQPHGPYYLAGVSFGGKVVFEMARQLHNRGERVALLALLDTYGPGVDPHGASPLKQLSMKERISIHRQNLSRHGLTYVLGKIKDVALGKIQAKSTQLVKDFKQMRCQFYERMGYPLPDDLQEFVFRQANLKASKLYVPKIYPDRVTLFKAIERDLRISQNADPCLGWSGLAGGGLEVYDIPGTHLGMLEEPNVRVLAQMLKGCLDREPENR